MVSDTLSAHLSKIVESYMHSDSECNIETLARRVLYRKKIQKIVSKTNKRKRENGPETSEELLPALFCRTAKKTVLVLLVITLPH